MALNISDDCAPRALCAPRLLEGAQQQRWSRGARARGEGEGGDDSGCCGEAHTESGTEPGPRTKRHAPERTIPVQTKVMLLRSLRSVCAPHTWLSAMVTGGHVSAHLTIHLLFFGHDYR